MRKVISTMLAAVLIVLPAVALPQSAQSILETARDKQIERWEGVDVYVVNQSIGGMSSQSYFQRADVELDDGTVETVFLPSPYGHPGADQCPGPQRMTAEAWEANAQAAEMMGAGMGEEMDRGMEEAGLPPGLLGATGSDPWASFDPRTQMSSTAIFSRAAADAERQKAAQPELERANARANADQMSLFMETAKVLGKETVDGKSAFHLRAENVNQVHGENGQEFVMQHVSMWLDAKEYVPLRMKIDGTMTYEGETKPMIIENSQSDYRIVPGSKMYEAHKQSMKISGTMTPEQEAQMLEAQKQMVDFEKQMETMPASQRKMMEDMMGPQLEMMRNMSAGGGFQTEIIVSSIGINPTVMAADGTPCPSSSAMPVTEISTAQIMDQGLTEMIQKDLAILGYETGSVTGEMNTQTAVSISRFQAENDMAVTGAVSPQLAGILSARASKVGGAATSSAPPQDATTLQTAQQACLQEKVAAKQASKKKKRGLGRLMSGIGRAASQLGGNDMASEIYKTTNDVYAVDATADDFAAAAKDLGLTQDEVAACQNPT